MHAIVGVRWIKTVVWHAVKRAPAALCEPQMVQNTPKWSANYTKTDRTFFMMTVNK